MALVKGSSVGLGAVAMAKDLGEDVKLVVETDSSAAKGIGLRRGVGKVRHLHTPLLWVQKRAQRGDLELKKVNGKYNVADLGTKFLTASEMEKHLFACGFTFEGGQSSLALRASV